jgi:hypothetical protein
LPSEADVGAVFPHVSFGPNPEEERTLRFLIDDLAPTDSVSDFGKVTNVGERIAIEND